MAIIHDGEVAKGLHLITVSDSLNGVRSEEFKRFCLGLAEQGITEVVVDLADVLLIDSRGLAALVAGYKLFGGKAQNFRLAGLQDQPKLVFELTGFDHIFEIYGTVFEAVTEEVIIPIELLKGIPILVPQLAIH